MFTLSHTTATDKYEEGFPAADCFALASNHPKQLAAIERHRAFSPTQQGIFFLDSAKL
jgi:hypothetical protein